MNPVPLLEVAIAVVMSALIIVMVFVGGPE
jgi:hypothetical protein